MSEQVLTYRVKVNDTSFNFTKEDLAGIDLVQLSDGSYHLVHAHQSIRATIGSTDISHKQIMVELEGEPFEVTISDELDLLLEKMGFGLSAGKVMKEIRAPMPGLVLEVSVAEGQEVTEGERLLILEAMKMENSIVVQTTARVKKIAVNAGQAVEKGQVLIEFE